MCGTQTQRVLYPKTYVKMFKFCFLPSQAHASKKWRHNSQLSPLSMSDTHTSRQCSKSTPTNALLLETQIIVTSLQITTVIQCGTLAGKRCCFRTVCTKLDRIRTILGFSSDGMHSAKYQIIFRNVSNVTHC